MEVTAWCFLIAALLFGLALAVEYTRRVALEVERNKLKEELELYVAAHEGNPYPIDVEEMRRVR